NQTVVAGTTLTTRPAALVTDASGNPVPGASVTFAVASGGGSGTTLTGTTNASGIATVGGWTIGTPAGSNTMTATVTGLTPATFTVTGIAGTAANILINAGNT